jgi:hypothetical protein
MDDKRKRMVVAGVVVGAVSVGLVLLARRVPREKWGETLGRMAKDALGVARSFYGNNIAFRVADEALNRVIAPKDSEHYA